MADAAVAPPQTLGRLAATGSSQSLMRGLMFSPSLQRYMAARLLGKRFPVRALPLHLVALPEQGRRNGFERLKVRLSGICGSDLALLYAKQSPALAAMYSFPAVLGHEILAELGGVRVVVNPLLSCHERGLPECPACLRGDDHLCQNIAEGNFSPGMIGFCADAPGGWAQRIMVHRERLIPVPESVPDERAVLTEPLAVVLHGLRQAWAGAKNDWPESILIIGAGTVGLLCLGMLRVLGYEGRVHTVARYPRQAELARAMGAEKVFESTVAAQKALPAKRYRGILGAAAWRGGYGGVIEASGSGKGLNEAHWAVAEGGKLLLLGAPAMAWHDFAPNWFREVKLIGSYAYSWDDFAQTVQMLPNLEGIEALVTHSFALEAWPDAIAAAVGRRGVKVVFKPIL